MTDPNNHISDQQLDQLLQDWSDQLQPSEEDLDRLIQSTEISIADSQPTSDKTTSVTSSELPLGKIIMAIAVALAVMVTGISWLSNNHSDLPTASLPVQTFTLQQRQQKKELLVELDRMFAGKRVWFAETETDVILGGDTLTGELGVASHIASESAVAMRLVLAKRPTPGSPWESVWSTDVVARSDQVVQFRTDESESVSTTFTAWSHVLPDGLVAFDLDLQFHDGAAGAISDNLLLTPGDVSVGGSVMVDGVEFQLFHAAELIGANS